MVEAGGKCTRACRKRVASELCERCVGRAVLQACVRAAKRGAGLTDGPRGGKSASFFSMVRDGPSQGPHKVRSSSKAAEEAREWGAFGIQCCDTAGYPML